MLSFRVLQILRHQRFLMGEGGGRAPNMILDPGRQKTSRYHYPPPPQCVVLFGHNFDILSVNFYVLVWCMSAKNNYEAG